MSQSSGVLQCNHVDVAGRRIRAAEVAGTTGKSYASTNSGRKIPTGRIYCPDSSMPTCTLKAVCCRRSEFARQAVRHGTVATVSDPHEIANVLGCDGVRWMLANAAQTPFHILFGAPSCVPATSFETAGGRIGVAEVTHLLATPGIGYLSEVMNFPGVRGGRPGFAGHAGGRPGPRAACRRPCPRIERRCGSSLRRRRHQHRPRVLNAGRGRGQTRGRHADPDSGRLGRAQFRCAASAAEPLPGTGDAMHRRLHHIRMT